MPMMVITTNNSTSVNAGRLGRDMPVAGGRGLKTSTSVGADGLLIPPLAIDTRILDSTDESTPDESPTVIPDCADQEPTGHMPFSRRSRFCSIHIAWIIAQLPILS
jgi:hypothetical protein